MALQAHRTWCNAIPVLLCRLPGKNLFRDTLQVNWPWEMLILPKLMCFIEHHRIPKYSITMFSKGNFLISELLFHERKEGSKCIITEIETRQLD